MVVAIIAEDIMVAVHIVVVLVQVVAVQAVVQVAVRVHVQEVEEQAALKKIFMEQKLVRKN